MTMNLKQLLELTDLIVEGCAGGHGTDAFSLSRAALKEATHADRERLLRLLERRRDRDPTVFRPDITDAIHAVNLTIERTATVATHGNYRLERRDRHDGSTLWSIFDEWLDRFSTYQPYAVERRWRELTGLEVDLEGGTLGAKV